MFIFLVSLALAASQPLHVMIDPGHGGVDSGAVHGKAREADISLKVGIELKKLLSDDPDFQVSMTRENDKNLSLQDRVKLASNAGAELFLSIHANASPDKRARGVEFYFQNHLPADEETLFLAATENQLQKSSESFSEGSTDPTKKNDVLSIIEDLKRQKRISNSLKLSRTLLQSWDKTGHSENNVIRQAPFYVVSRVNIPSVLVELGFLTNNKEAEKLLNPSYQREIAVKIFNGLKIYRSQNKSTPISITEAR